MSKKRGKKILLSILGIAVALVIVLCATVGIVWGNEISTVMSMKQLRQRDDAHKDGSVYQMEVKGGFYFDEYLARGSASTDAELIAFISDSITKGLIDMGLEESSISCSSFTAATANGDRLFARNYDFDKTNTCIVYTNPGNGRHAS